MTTTRVWVLVVPRLDSWVLQFLFNSLPLPPTVNDAVADTLANKKPYLAVTDTVPDARRMPICLFRFLIRCVDSDVDSVCLLIFSWPFVSPLAKFYD